MNTVTQSTAISRVFPEANLMQYEAMCFAIARCHIVDEAKEIHDKAIAIEVYARQAKNMDAEIKAKEIRVRAERRTGELLKELPRAPSPNPAGKNQHEVTSDGQTQPKSEYAETLERTGMTRDKAARYQKLAEVPADKFEEALADKTKPASASAIMTAANGATTMDKRSLDVWGKLKSIDRADVFGMDAREIYGGMTQVMQEDVQRLITPTIDWLLKLRRACRSSHDTRGGCTPEEYRRAKDGE